MNPLQVNADFLAKSPEPNRYPDLPYKRDATLDTMTSMWCPTDDELAALIKGEVVVVRVAGGQPLPMMVTTVALHPDHQAELNEIRDAEWAKKNGVPKA